MTIDNDESDFYTIVDVSANDRLGLLYDLTRTLADHDLEIYISKATTVLDQVADTFYVKDARGRRIPEARRSRASWGRCSARCSTRHSSTRRGAKKASARREASVHLTAAIDGFLTHLAVERGLSHNTLEAYGRDLARLADAARSWKV